MADFKPTDEQQAICDATGRVIKVKAFAGTGKSSTFKHLARTRPGKKILYLAFNKAIKEEAATSFPGNVKPMTGHGLAYASKGKIYGAIPKKLQGDIRPFHIASEVASSTRQMPAAVHNLYGGRVIETVKSFMVSGDHEFLPRHVSLGDSPAERKHMGQGLVLSDAKRVWDAMCNVDSKVPMLHDGYLKLYQLSNPRLPYDELLVDEAQDTNPVVQAIISAQAHCRTYYVGDEHQSIYLFRGAQNSMRSVEADHTFGLTGSFRFGEAVAEVANDILWLKGEKMQLRGLGPAAELRKVDPAEGSALVSRGNATLFREAVKALSQKRPFSFVGPLHNYRFDLITDAFRLHCGEEPNDAFTKSFSSFDEFSDYSEQMDDRELKARIKLVGEYDADIPRLIDAITRNSLPWTDAGASSMPADTIVLTTAHKSKGLEFDAVRLGDDYQSMLDEDTGELVDFGALDPAGVEEINLQYVAATRAKKALQLSEGLEAYTEVKQQIESGFRPK
ncbi:UvrD-helicase domain-containing protein [Xanthomonas euvesicatoria]